MGDGIKQAGYHGRWTRQVDGQQSVKQSRRRKPAGPHADRHRTNGLEGMQDAGVRVHAQCIAHGCKVASRFIAAWKLLT